MIKEFKFPEVQYAQGDYYGDGDPVCVCTYDNKDDAASQALDETSAGPYVATYKLVGVEKVTKNTKYRYKAS